jgi:hypothetical protein
MLGYEAEHEAYEKASNRGASGNGAHNATPSDFVKAAKALGARTPLAKARRRP